MASCIKNLDLQGTACLCDDCDPPSYTGNPFNDTNNEAYDGSDDDETLVDNSLHHTDSLELCRNRRNSSTKLESRSERRKSCKRRIKTKSWVKKAWKKVKKFAEEVAEDMLFPDPVMVCSMTGVYIPL